MNNTMSYTREEYEEMYGIDDYDETIGVQICPSCGRKLNKVLESRGEFWGIPAYEELWLCPKCD